MAAVALVAVALVPTRGRAIGEATAFDARQLVYDGGNADARPTAMRRLAWEVRKRTSVDTRLAPSRVRLSDPALFDQPFLWWTGDAAFPPIPAADLAALRRFVTLGGFVFVDDASPGERGFDESVRRDLGRAFPGRLAPLSSAHVLYRSFYLLDRPVGRVVGPDGVEAIVDGGRAAVVYSRHDVGGALARDNFGTWEHAVEPGGDRQRELATRFAVNVVLYTLCLDYKDDQVHAPFILRRRGGP